MIKGNEPLYNRLTSAGYDLFFKETAKTKTGIKSSIGEFNRVVVHGCITPYELLC
jgi:hypothetical protein